MRLECWGEEGGVDWSSDPGRQERREAAAGSTTVHLSPLSFSLLSIYFNHNCTWGIVSAWRWISLYNRNQLQRSENFQPNMSVRYFPVIFLDFLPWTKSRREKLVRQWNYCGNIHSLHQSSQSITKKNKVNPGSPPPPHSTSISGRRPHFKNSLIGP